MRKYDKYKDSGVSAIGAIPNDWSVKPLKRFAKICNGQDQKEIAVETGIYPIIGTGGEFGRTNSFLYHGPSVILGRKGTIDKPQFIEGPFWSVDTAYYTEIYKEVDPKFFFYCCQTISFDMYKYGSAVPSMTQETLNHILFPSPTYREQKAIGKFLDYKTYEIANYIKRKRLLIELLHEEKAALINQAVTKGIDGNVPMKPSGIEWLGDIPAHWEKISFKRVCKRIEVGIAEAATHAYRETGIPILRATNIKGGIITGELLYIEESFAEKNISKRINANDILTVRTGNAGLSAVIPEELDGCQCFTMLVSTLQVNEHPEYFNYLLNSIYGRNYFDLEAWGTAQKNISVPILQEFPAFKIPVYEQGQIVDFIKKEEKKINRVLEKIEKEIELLDEYRQSLIYEVVTGKRKVDAPIEELIEAVV